MERSRLDLFKILKRTEEALLVYLAFINGNRLACLFFFSENVLKQGSPYGVAKDPGVP